MHNKCITKMHNKVDTKCIMIKHNKFNVKERCTYIDISNPFDNNFSLFTTIYDKNCSERKILMQIYSSSMKFKIIYFDIVIFSETT